jgi:hypothetical protein
MTAVAHAMWFVAGYLMGLATWQAVEMWRDWRKPKG